MKKNFIQGSESWHKWRSEGLGASDSPIIMGLSPWTSRSQLYREKTTGFRKSHKNAATDYGHKMEPEVRHWAEMLFGVPLPAACFESDDIPFIRASLDGISQDGKIAVEIKCPYKNKSDHELARQQKIPPKYYWQLVHQMIAANLEKIYYISFDGVDKQCVPLQLDPAKAAELVSELQDFWHCIQTKQEPQDHVPNAVIVDDKNWLELAKNYVEIDQQIKVLEARRSGMREALCEQVQMHKKITGSGVTISKLERRGQIDYSQIPQLESVDLDQYRKSSQISYHVTTN